MYSFPVFLLLTPFADLWLCMLFWQGDIERINFKICVWCLHMHFFFFFFFFFCRNYLRKDEKSFEECICVWEFDCPDKIQLLTYIWVPHVSSDLHPINSDISFDLVLMKLLVPYMRSDVHPNTNACMLSTCTYVLEDAVTGCRCCLCSRDKFSSHASLFATCCLRSSRCFHQRSQSTCLLYRYDTCKVWTDLFDLCFHQNVWWDPQFTTCHVL